MFYFKIWKALSEEFHVVCIDLLGFGRSSRPKFTCKTSEEAEDFFVLSIEKWREQMQLDSFSICCHSFGGYVMGRYALRFSEHIKKLIFLSSLGVDYVPEDIDKGLDEFYKTLSSRQRRMFRLQKKLPKFLITIAPFTPLRILERISGRFLKRGMRCRMGRLSREEFQAILHPPLSSDSKACQSEKAIHVLFTRNFIPKHPLIEAIDAPDGFKARGIGTCFIYCYSYWLDMNMNGPKVSKTLGNEGHRVYVISESDNHIYFDNPEELVNIMMSELGEIISKCNKRL
ncbi:unnamed protein product [Moneuplotes crassus]|uniref:AB hydrolase-1 domain-containing protein n=1 Tax=Euplotes crassus TaxID=5936 RepID=A0AAD1XGV1_EUPCR|nr:unnamed protein product [Moneuplotes crassus]